MKSNTKGMFSLCVLMFIAAVMGCEDPYVNIGSNQTLSTDGDSTGEASDNGQSDKQSTDFCVVEDCNGDEDCALDTDCFSDTDASHLDDEGSTDCLLDSDCSNDISDTDDGDTQGGWNCWDEWPEEETVPAVWNTVHGCLTIGDFCTSANQCGDGSICELDTGICVPSRFDGEIICNSTYPFFVADMCMSYEEASCYCVGLGREVYPECDEGPLAVFEMCFSN